VQILLQIYFTVLFVVDLARQKVEDLEKKAEELSEQKEEALAQLERVDLQVGRLCLDNFNKITFQHFTYVVTPKVE